MLYQAACLYRQTLLKNVENIYLNNCCIYVHTDLIFKIEVRLRYIYVYSKEQSLYFYIFAKKCILKIILSIVCGSQNFKMT